MSATPETYADQARNHIATLIAEAERRGDQHVDIRSGDVGKELWPGKPRAAIVCGAMLALMKCGDYPLYTPRGGVGLRVVIRYQLPRP